MWSIAPAAPASLITFHVKHSASRTGGLPAVRLGRAPTPARRQREDRGVVAQRSGVLRGPLNSSWAVPLPSDEPPIFGQLRLESCGRRRFT